MPNRTSFGVSSIFILALLTSGCFTPIAESDHASPAVPSVASASAGTFETKPEGTEPEPDFNVPEVRLGTI